MTAAPWQISFETHNGLPAFSVPGESGSHFERQQSPSNPSRRFVHRERVRAEALCDIAPRHWRGYRRAFACTGGIGADSGRPTAIAQVVDEQLTRALAQVSRNDIAVLVSRGELLGDPARHGMSRIPGHVLGNWDHDMQPLAASRLGPAFKTVGREHLA